MTTTLPTLTRNQILAAKDDRIEPVPIPEWGGQVYVRRLTAAEYDDFENSQIDDDGKPHKDNLRARFAVLVACDAEGCRIFDDEDALILGEKALVPVDRICDAGLALNKRSKAELESLAKNSEPGQTEG